MKRTFKILFFFLSFSFIAHSQTAIKSRGDRAYKMKAYVTAIKEYENLSKKGKLTSQQLLNLSNSYYKIKDFENASKKYMAYVNSGKTLSLEEFNQYIQSLKMAEYSRTVIVDAIATKLDSLPREIAKRYKDLSDEAQRQKPFSRTTTSYEFNNLSVNTQYSDFGVTILPDSMVMFSSARENKAYSYIYKNIDQPFINIYKSKLDTDGSIDSLRVEKYVLKSKMHNSSPFYDGQSKRLFYTQSEVKKNRLKFNNYQNNFRIVYGFLNDKKEIKQLFYYPKKLNNYSYGDPFYDAKTKRLYFVSDMPGGYGGTDIYYVEMNAEGVVTSDPVNLGETVNSFANEMFPSIIDGKLYFSSDLFIGDGGLDVYTSNIYGGTFEESKHLGAPINSISDDFSYRVSTISRYKKIGYLSSNRKGGKGDDDIYNFIETKTIKSIKVSGTIRQKGAPSIVLKNAKINILDTNGRRIDNILSDNYGNYSTLLPIDKDYVFQVEKEGYVTALDTIFMTKVQSDNPISKDYYLLKELVKDKYNNIKINLEPVYFKYDDASITPRAEKQLQVAINYLKKYPKDKFKLEAHTDSRGTKAYNLALSKRRAESVYKYLLEKEIQPNRIISIKGYGETRLINECKDGVKCTEEQHEKNRRTDFVIIK